MRNKFTMIAVVLYCAACGWARGADGAGLSRTFAALEGQRQSTLGLVASALGNEEALGISPALDQQLQDLLAKLDSQPLADLAAKASAALVAGDKAQLKSAMLQLKKWGKNYQPSGVRRLFKPRTWAMLVQLDLEIAPVTITPGGVPVVPAGPPDGPVPVGSDGGSASSPAGTPAPVAGTGGGDGSITTRPATPTQPLQTSTGPGGAGSLYNDFVVTDLGSGDSEVWIYEPKGAPAGAPVIDFMHGYNALSPSWYSDWLTHLVLQGNIVIFPKYQASSTTPPSKYTPNAIAAIHTALNTLQQPGHVAPDLTKFAAVGHSYGGIIAANLAALASANNLPKVTALVCCDPDAGGFNTYANYALIPPGTLLLSIFGADDNFAGSADAKKIFYEATQVALTDKDFLTVQSDSHGTPTLTADHVAPNAFSSGTTNALDWYGFWKWTDALTDSAFYGTYRSTALGGGADQTSMGTWSDGVPVNPALETKAP